MKLNWNQRLLMLRRAWSDLEREMMPAVIVSLVFGLALLILSRAIWPIKMILALACAAPLAWVYLQLMGYAGEHPELSETELVPLEGLSDEDEVTHLLADPEVRAQLRRVPERDQNPEQ